MIKRKKALKRIVCGTCALGVASLAITPAFAAVTLLGDANGDSAFNINDIALAQQALLNVNTATTQGAQNCDMDSNGIFNAVDLLIMKRTPYSSSTTDDNIVTSIEYTSSSVTLYNVSGAVVNAADATNVTVSDKTYVTIVVPGEFDVSGQCSEGQLAVNCDKTTYASGLVTLNLKGLTLSNTSTSPVYVAAIDDEVVISCKNGYTNTISDGTSYTNDDADSGAIYSCDDIKFKGKGILNVNGNCADAIVSKNDIKIWNGTLNVNAVDDGIRGKDSVRIGDPDDTDFSSLNVTVATTSGDGIKSTNADDVTTTDKAYGLVRICGGTINVDSYGDAISGEQTVEVNGGNLTLSTYEGYTYSSGSSNWGDTSTTETASCKGIKAVGLYTTDSSGTATYSSMGDLNINGGTIVIDSTDDCLHCAGTMNIIGGTLTLYSADDGVHSDTTVNIGTETDVANYTLPRIDVAYSYEGIEGQVINNYSGAVTVYSTDDAYNAGGGADGSGTNDQWGGGWNPGGNMGGTTASSSDYQLNFYGGYVYCNASGDGIDSNGSMSINGGYVFVSQSGGGNAPIDAGEGFTPTYNGGVLIAGGSSDMFVSPSTYSFLSQTSVSAGSTVTFTNSSGTVLATMKFSNASSKMVFCCPESSITAYSGGTLSGTSYFVESSSTSDNGLCGYGGTISDGKTITASSGSGNNPWG